jgi:Neutral/alkaline non-lysosomal ceramidase, N-terminal
MLAIPSSFPRRLLALALLSPVFLANAAELRVGAARVDVTPADPATPVPGKFDHERLYARAIVLDNGTARAVLIGADQAGIPEAAWKFASQQIAKELNCPVANILMSATHTHSGWIGNGPPPGMFRPDPNGPPPPIVAQLVDVVRQAQAKLQPAQVGFGKGFAYLNVNRDTVDPTTHLWTQGPNLQGSSDKSVSVIKFTTPEGQPIAAYIDYAMHPVNGYLSGFVSADFAGATSRYVEKAYGDKMVAVFAQGASGDQNPLYLRAATNVLASRSGSPISGNVLTREPVEAPLRDGKVSEHPLDPAVRETLEKVMESEGVLLGEEVIRVMTNTTRMESSSAIEASQDIATCPGRKRLDKAREGTPGSYEDGDPVNIRLGVLRIGNIALASVDAEIYSAIGNRIKLESPMANTVVVTLANGASNSGYIPNDAAFGAYTFQVLGSRLKPGCAEDAIVGGLVKQIEADTK